MPPLIPVILSGGAGTRLWPVSRHSHPKPFMRLPDGQTLAEKTLHRALALGNGDVVTVTGRDHHLITRDTYERAGADLSRMTFLLEPVGRNTAPAIAMAGHLVRSRWGDDATLLVMPADHLIADTAAFGAAVNKARQLAAQGYLVTFGIEPTRPETGYGYIRRGAAIDRLGYAVDRFVEKPDAATAQDYLDDGGYLWNGGIVCFSAGRLLEALERHAPDIASSAKVTAAALPSGDSRVVELPEQQFAAMPGISIDYALMEKASRVAVVPLSVGWSDVGSWKTISELTDADAAGNRVVGHAVVVDSRNAYIQAGDRLIAAVGVDNLVIIDAGDAVLVGHIDSAQEVKAVVDRLKAQGHPAAEQHPVEFQAWGHATTVSVDAHATVRRLQLRAGSAYTEPDGRPRSWTVLQGEVNLQDRSLPPGAAGHSPAGSQLTLTCVESVVLVEVALTDDA